MILRQEPPEVLTWYGAGPACAPYLQPNFIFAKRSQTLLYTRRNRGEGSSVTCLCWVRSLVVGTGDLSNHRSEGTAGEVGVRVLSLGDGRVYALYEIRRFWSVRVVSSNKPCMIRDGSRGERGEGGALSLSCGKSPSSPT